MAKASRFIEASCCLSSNLSSATSASGHESRVNLPRVKSCSPVTRGFGYVSAVTPTKIYGLTGGVGMGKTTVAQLLERRGVAVVDTDVLARKVVEPGQPALAAIQEMFGGAVLAQDGSLRREELARRVFASDISRKQLEAILHPRIRALWMAQTEQWRAEGITLGVVVIPLLYETNSAKHFDKVICVACSAPSQQQRLAARGWSAEQIQQRIAAQQPIEKKLTAADHVVWTEGSPEVTMTQVDRILSQL